MYYILLLWKQKNLFFSRTKYGFKMWSIWRRSFLTCAIFQLRLCDIRGMSVASQPAILALCVDESSRGAMCWKATWRSAPTSRPKRRPLPLLPPPLSISNITSSSRLRRWLRPRPPPPPRPPLSPWVPKKREKRAFNADDLECECGREWIPLGPLF